jgi:hypothetical protein
MPPGVVEHCDEAPGPSSVEERELLEQNLEFIREIVMVHDEAEEGFISSTGEQSEMSRWADFTKIRMLDVC